MKSLLLLLLLIGTFSYGQVALNSRVENKALDATINIEDEHGYLITDSIARHNYFKEKKTLLDNFNKKSAPLSNQTPVPLCLNGSFEQFETIQNTNYLTDFMYGITDIENPTQCKTPTILAGQNITQYNPSSFNSMATTVPANYLDEFIGNINAFDQFALKINYRQSSTALSVIQARRFKTDNETTVKFNYKAVLQSIVGAGHLNEQPFFKARVINNAGVIVSEFCLIADAENCIFTQAPVLQSGSVVMYTANWQSGLLDISSIPNNENFTIEFFASRCGLGGHFGYAFVDDICILNSSENLQGSIELDPLYKNCPTFPFSICGDFTIPNSGGINATIENITLNIVDANNTVVYTSQTPASLDLTTKRFCFDIAATNLPNIATGAYNVNVSINYGITQTNCVGTNFAAATDNDANPGWDIWFLNCIDCDINLQPTSLLLCDINRDGKEFFNLSNANTQIVNPQTGLVFTYYSTLSNATNNTNQIVNFTNYESPSTVIFIRVTKNATCYKIIPINLIVKYPFATISGILNVCDGNTTLTASPGASYLWANNETTQSISVNSPGTYSVIVTDSFGCTSTGTVTILGSLVAVLPTIVVTQPSCTVINGSIAVTSPAAEFSFDNGVTWVTNSFINNLPVGTYVVKIKSVAGCLSYPITINIIPFFSSYPNCSAISPSFCGGLGSITVNTVADEYSFDDGITWTTNNTMSDLPAGNYFIRTRGSDGCISNSNNVELFSVFLDLPSFTIQNAYCGNLGSITITTPAEEYSFDGGNTWQLSNTKTNLIVGSYLLRIKNSLGCTSPFRYAYIRNFEDSYPEYSVANAGCDTYASITITTAGDEYSFDGGISWTTSPVLSNLAGNSSHQLVVRIGTCTSLITSMFVNSIFYPLPVVTDYETRVCDNLNDGSENINLTTYNGNIIQIPASFNFGYYTSLNGAQLQLPQDRITNFTSFNLSNSNNNVFVRVTSATNCVSIAKLKFNFIDSPVINMLDQYPLCEFKTVTIDAGSGFTSYLWSTGETTRKIIVNQIGNYSVTVTKDNNGLICNATKNFQIFLSNVATISNIDIQDWTLNENVISVFLTNNSIGNYEYSLDGINYQTSSVFSGLEVGSYNVYVKDLNDCGIIKKIVFILYYPNYFTPNGDGVNDTWQIYFSQFEKDLKTAIYDRSGKMIKVLANNSGWDGLYNGYMMPADDYWFVVTRQNGEEHRGHFSLKR
jgi:gliding motility-associated-like protein